jgi:ABC-type dipeptide/oligopeptide/nickel transport system ATPase component
VTTGHAVTSPLLRVSHLRTVFPRSGAMDFAAVNDVTFDIARGETVGLVGESGSGKSLTALSIVQLVTPPGRIAGGSVELEGQNLLSFGPDEMRRVRGRQIGFVFQEPSAALNPVYTIGYQIAETLAVHDLVRGRAARNRAIALLDAVQVPDPERRAREYPHQLSGGLRQRAVIALALAAEPQLLIADEPTTALDARVQADVLDLLRALRRAMSLSILLITHDFGVVAELADRVLVMDRGSIVESGLVSSIFDSAVTPYTRRLLEAADDAADIPSWSSGHRS